MSLCYFILGVENILIMFVFIIVALLCGFPCGVHSEASPTSAPTTSAMYACHTTYGDSSEVCNAAESCSWYVDSCVHCSELITCSDDDNDNCVLNEEESACVSCDQLTVPVALTKSDCGVYVTTVSSCQYQTTSSACANYNGCAWSGSACVGGTISSSPTAAPTMKKLDTFNSSFYLFFFVPLSFFIVVLLVLPRIAQENTMSYRRQYE